MAMLIDAATDGAVRPKGCAVRRRTKPLDVSKGLNLDQVATVAESHYGVVVTRRTGRHAMPVAKATRQIVAGRGFLLQGNNAGFVNKGSANHAIYVHAVRGGTPEMPAQALVYDPQRRHPRWLPWSRVLAFGAALTFDDGRRLGNKYLYVGLVPRRPTPAQLQDEPLPVEAGVRLRSGAVRLDRPDRTRAHPPVGHRVNVRSTPLDLDQTTIIDTLAEGELFIAFQRHDRGARPAAGKSTIWYGNKDGTEWVHRSGLRQIDPPGAQPGAAAFAGPATAAPTPGSPGPLPPGAPAPDDGDPATDMVEDDELDPELLDFPDEVRNGDLRPDQQDPTAVAPTSDPTPDDTDADFAGAELSDADLDALPVEEDDGP
jgi:hypothetical protein